MPPPNVTGSLHMGHALTYTIQDVLIRYAKLCGKIVRWQAGFDHAGIATQMLAERELLKVGKSKNDMTREEFLNFITQRKDDSMAKIMHQIDLLNLDIDWSNKRFTLDESASKAVTKCFVQLYKEGLIYKAKKMVNWDPELRTTISDLEVINKECKGKLYHIKYISECGLDYLDIATTRPETIFGDSAIAVNPLDERYKRFHGKKFIVPIVNRTVMVIADDYVDMLFGTGVLKVTPAHDVNDFEIGIRHKLNEIDIFDESANLNNNVPSEFVGLNRSDARKKVIEVLKEQSLLLGEELINHSIPHGDRSGAVIESKLTLQWFFDVSYMAERAISSANEIEFFPSHWMSTYKNWLQDVKHWCISRQLVWGHQIPAWYDKDGNIVVAELETEVPDGFVRDEDVLDTWFSSALWAFSSLGWPDDDALLENYCPSSVLVTGFDIIFFWVARMVMMTQKFIGRVPFEKVLICPIVCDANGNKMSKTKGNVIDPVEIIENYSSSALRLSLVSLPLFRRHIKFDVKNVELSRNFLTKVKNALKFFSNVGLSSDVSVCQFELEINTWILERVMNCLENFDIYMKRLQIHFAFSIIKDFFLNDVCNWYIEMIKHIPINDEIKQTVSIMMEFFMSLLYIFAPEFVNEQWIRKVDSSIFVKIFELSSSLRENSQNIDLVNVRQSSEKYNELRKNDVIKMNVMMEIISNIRSIKGILGLNESWCKIYIEMSQDLWNMLTVYGDSFKRLAKVEFAEKSNDFVSLSVISLNYLSATVYYDNKLITPDRIENLQKKLTKLAREIESLEDRLENAKFCTNASEGLVEDLTNQLNGLKESFARTKFVAESIHKSQSCCVME